MKLKIAVLGLLLILSGCVSQEYEVQVVKKNVDSYSSDEMLTLDDSLLTDNYPEGAEGIYYLEAIDTNDIELRTLATNLIQDCPPADKECSLVKIYSYVSNHYTYAYDPGLDEVVQTPSETITISGGDCEDLTILTQSLLENIGVNTYLVLTKDHAFSLACIEDIDNLRYYIGEDMWNNVMMAYGALENKETINIKPSYAYYYGGNGSKFEDPIHSAELIYTIESDQPVSVYVVSSSDSFDKWAAGEHFLYNGPCSREEIYQGTASCSMTSDGGIIIENLNKENAKVEINITYIPEVSYTELTSDLNITYYNMNGMECVVVDPTYFEVGYLGYMEGNQNMTAFDPNTFEVMELEN